MNPLSIFGLVAVALMLFCDSQERKHHVYTLFFGFACILGSVYGFLQGAWPFGALEGVWAVMKFFQWYHRRKELPAGTSWFQD